MSWSEVKKINSNLDVPLDELIDGNQTNNLIRTKLVYVESNLDTTPYLVIEIMGKGKIYTVADNTEYGGSSYEPIPALKIVVDGNTIFDYALKNDYVSSNYDPCIIGLLSRRYIQSYGNTVNAASFKINGISRRDLSGSYGYIPHYDTGTTIVNYTNPNPQRGENYTRGYSGTFLGYFLDDYIKFNSSIKVYIYNLGNVRVVHVHNCWIDYSLDE